MPARENLRRRRQRVHGRLAGAVDQNGVQALHRNKSPQRGRSPVIECGDRMGFRAQFRGQCRDDKQGVEMAGVIGIVDPLPRLGCTALPIGASADQQPDNTRQSEAQ
jgi:hypothetical protein